MQEKPVFSPKCPKYFSKNVFYMSNWANQLSSCFCSPGELVVKYLPLIIGIGGLGKGEILRKHRDSNWRKQLSPQDWETKERSWFMKT